MSLQQEFVTASSDGARLRAQARRERKLRFFPPPPPVVFAPKVRIIEIKPVEPEPPVPVPVAVVEPPPLAPLSPGEIPSLHRILLETARAHKLSMTTLKSAGKQTALVNARFEYFYRAMEETLKSLPEIGRVVNRDHSCVINGVSNYCIEHGLPLPRGATWECRRTKAWERWKKKRDAQEAGG